MPAISLLFSFFFFNDTATTEIYTLSLHDALPIYAGGAARLRAVDGLQGCQGRLRGGGLPQVLPPGRELRPVPAFGADPPPDDQEVHLSEPEIRGQRDDPEVAALGGHAGEVLPERLDQAGPGHGLGGHEEALPA